MVVSKLSGENIVYPTRRRRELTSRRGKISKKIRVVPGDQEQPAGTQTFS